jgi:hypothetical protein
VQKANVSGQDSEKERVTLRSLFKVVGYRTSSLWCGSNIAGKKKMIKKQRRSKEKD